MRSIKQLISLEGRVAVVTGGGGYIGSAFCQALAEVGASVSVIDISEEKVTRTAFSVERDFGREALPLVVDLSDEPATRAVPAKVLERFGRMDILVNCAAFVGTSNLAGWSVPFQEQQTGAWRSALEVNLTSVFALVQASAPALKASGSGSVVNVASIYGMVGPDMRLYDNTGMGNPAAYAAGKGGLLQLTRWLATVLAPDVRVNALSPGGVWRNQDRLFQRRYEDRTPLRRMATEEDLIGALVFLASDLSSYVTGQNIVIDGGWTAL